MRIGQLGFHISESVQTTVSDLRNERATLNGGSVAIG